MNVSSIYSLARILSYTSSSQTWVSDDATLQIFANLVYHDLENTIVSQVNEDFFYNEWTDNIVSGKREYLLPIKSWTKAWLKKLLSVSIYKTSNDVDYTKLEENRLTNLPYDVNKYDGEQEFFYIADNSVFIYPTPTENITKGIKVYGVSNLWDIETWWDETTVKIPVEYHDLIAQWMTQYIFQAQWKTNESLSALNTYNQKKQQMVWELTDRNAWTHTSELPNLSHYA